MTKTIYKISCKNNDIKNCYIGSTSNIKKRIIDHHHCCNNTNSPNHNLKLYKIIRENGNFENWFFEILIQYNKISKDDLRKREQEYFEFYKPSLNTNQPFCPPVLYREQNKIYLNNKSLTHYYNNKEEINKKRLQKFKCECGRMYTHCHKKRHLNSNIHKKLMHEKQIQNEKIIKFVNFIVCYMFLKSI